jgi:hypothetical protein
VSTQRTVDRTWCGYQWLRFNRRPAPGTFDALPNPYWHQRAADVWRAGRRLETAVWAAEALPASAHAGSSLSDEVQAWVAEACPEFCHLQFVLDHIAGRPCAARGPVALPPPGEFPSTELEALCSEIGRVLRTEVEVFCKLVPGVAWATDPRLHRVLDRFNFFPPHTSHQRFPAPGLPCVNDAPQSDCVTISYPASTTVLRRLRREIGAGLDRLASCPGVELAIPPDAYPPNVTTPRGPRLRVDVAAATVTMDGIAHAVDPDVAEWLDALIGARGDWISLEAAKQGHPQLEGKTKPARLMARVPEKIKALVECKRAKGARIALDQLHTPSPDE